MSQTTIIKLYCVFFNRGDVLNVSLIAFFLNVFTQFSKFSDKNNIILKEYCCAWICYLLCKKTALNLSAIRTLVSEKVFETNSYFSDLSDSLKLSQATRGPGAYRDRSCHTKSQRHAVLGLHNSFIDCPHSNNSVLQWASHLAHKSRIRS